MIEAGWKQRVDKSTTPTALHSLLQKAESEAKEEKEKSDILDNIIHHLDLQKKKVSPTKVKYFVSMLKKQKRNDQAGARSQDLLGVCYSKLLTRCAVAY